MFDTTITDRVSASEMAGFMSAATTRVFGTMLGRKVIACEPFIERNASAPASGVVAVVGIAGDWVGTGSMSCSSAFACRAASSLLMTEYDRVNDDVLDALAEITNMIVGNIKSSLEERLGSMGLSVPTVIFGSNFQTRNAGRNEWLVLPFRCGAESLHVQICLTLNRDRESRTNRAPFPLPHLLST